MNILPLPEKFDLNEWFIIGIIAAGYVFLWICHRISFKHKLLVLMYTISVARISDHVLAGTGVDAYDVMDNGTFELFDILTYAAFAPFAVFFLEIYEKYRFKGLRLAWYMAAFAVFSTLVERVAILCGAFTFKEWHSLFSFVFYLTMVIALFGFNKIIKRTEHA